ncbi:M1 family metallopeptidase [Fructilactobacillus hinvesii]|uniref:Aminopeptidase n=1 Tax=Fructilactobacillus hinvesii TaxID=2940300 RepID=A0ABY5BSL7_9LACO|nr:M1 family metallopeptidase [Fructilactobacillus hinvesii]USS88118.1 M1 family metallopeptidase [Fructilactobacillus hinvesii]
MAGIERFYSLFQPEHYDLFIDVNREQKTITGTTKIHGHASQAHMAVNQKDLQVSQVLANGAAVPFTTDNEAEAIRIDLPEAGDVDLEIKYRAPLTDTMMGIYPSYYEVDGEKKQVVGTQFETTFARQAFPGIDEPEAKATFTLALKFDEHAGETVLANMPEDHVEDGVHYFKPTVKMSTYLVAFAFGDLQSKLTTTKSGVQVGVFATKAHQPKELDFALDIAKRSIEFYEDFYQTPYPLPHSWQLALPDFSAGAMENWGLITYREAYLLLDPDNTPLETKELVATVIAHELAHQWFGDLVTMKWWDDLWLNESFANMMEYVAIDALQPDWKVWEMFQTSEVPMALSRDATDGVQSVHVEVHDPAEIDALFDGAIVYAKGARMLVMVRALLGDDALRQGLRQYFIDHQYGNAEGKDLWKALGDVSGLDIGKIMSSWLDQPGYPVISVSVADDGQLTLKQQQFFIGGGEDQGREWQIPLDANYQAAPQIMADKEIKLGDYQTLRKEAGEPFRVNVGNNSHVVVQYDQALLDDILDHVSALSVIDQRQLLQDLRLLASAQRVSYARLLPLLRQFAASQSSIVNAELYTIANSLKMFVTPGTPAEQELREFFGELVSANIERLGLVPRAGETNDDQKIRPIVFNAALYAQTPAVIEKAHALFTEYQDRLVKLPADVRALILKNEVQNYGSSELFDQLLHDYATTSEVNYRDDLAVALPQVTDPQLAERLVGQFENADVIKPQDLRAWYRGLLANELNQQVAWDWIRKEWDWLEATVGGDMEFATFITVTANIFHTPERLAEFKAFFEPKLGTPGLAREIKMDVRTIAGKVDLVMSEQADVLQALSANV